MLGEMFEDRVAICWPGDVVMLPLASWRDERRRRRRWSMKRNWFSTMVRRISGTEVTNAETWGDRGASDGRVVEQLGGLVGWFGGAVWLRGGIAL